MATKITTDDVRVEADRIVVHGAGGKALANSLVKKNAVALAEMAEKLGFVHPEDISIESDGSVEIRGQGVVDRVKSLSRDAGGGSSLWDTNCGCK
ncbi:hypothetical protein Sa4125_43370 [Aureimonas sp. SA4125]|uniref:hypothetical protein n=1 Tax=Aureimonas sp. SA4125 TaxID=2826993 RepID=UPI001CC60D70|nr:hypothetical protein [Aureimonas sp. SA4125]BDA86795.1 hypothetical protein Sa4125_43370 [Aureimonas sp. SA4125]